MLKNYYRFVLYGVILLIANILFIELAILVFNTTIIPNWHNHNSEAILFFISYFPNMIIQTMSPHTINSYFAIFSDIILFLWLNSLLFTLFLKIEIILEG